jgi:2-methylisocitrate lyase-like PEP mutase family enzyme
MTPEDAYEEALRRIREAEEAGATNLFLSQLDSLNQLPRELAGLQPVQT